MSEEFLLEITTWF